MIPELSIFLKWLISFAIVSFIGALITRWVQYKAKVVCYVGQVAHFQISSQDQNATTNIMTHHLFLQNLGKKSAMHVKLAHRFLPQITINGLIGALTILFFGYRLTLLILKLGLITPLCRP
jgi:hypothetical protein